MTDYTDRRAGKSTWVDALPPGHRGKLIRLRVPRGPASAEPVPLARAP
ncbi:MAG: hypothetical protein QN158_11780 [Armatimonadota bacterium]|nr:hypothetical protein [Armatimonadota bacterium]MDR7449674.1 hypothetical protein [Armatimonadota bacterium]MDR7480719.1 hypothetical protein [Armatimonadota bacterium]MDR7489027.1 hypothetical protein [Armatimonadota bacterium]MDR7502503.1 hypothetical protein [Armatimonadota bacterium]